MTDKFKGRYEVSDGYVGGSRPHHFKFDASDLEDDMTDVDLVNAYEQAAQDHFEEHITPSVERVDEFIKWAREQLAARGKE
jgi:predicted sulfurtransferase